MGAHAPPGGGRLYKGIGPFEGIIYPVDGRCSSRLAGRHDVWRQKLLDYAKPIDFQPEAPWTTADAAKEKIGSAIFPMVM